MQEIAFPFPLDWKNALLPTLVFHSYQSLSFSGDFEERGHQLGACHSHWCSPSL